MRANSARKHPDGTEGVYIYHKSEQMESYINEILD